MRKVPASTDSPFVFLADLVVSRKHGIGNYHSGYGRRQSRGQTPLQQRLKRLEQDRALERERTRIAQDLHDINGCKLCRISFLASMPGSETIRRTPGADSLHVR